MALGLESRDRTENVDYFLAQSVQQCRDGGDKWRWRAGAHASARGSTMVPGSVFRPLLCSEGTVALLRRSRIEKRLAKVYLATATRDFVCGP